MSKPIIDVNDDGLDANGCSYDNFATGDAVSDGFMVNRAVRIRFPDGHVEDANEVRITEKGMAVLKMQMPAAH